MQNLNERQVCHRAEDLVTYLYGEATAAESRDFAAHMQQCDACRAEFAVFNQVHHSIVAWRDEAIGSVVVDARQTSIETESGVAPSGTRRQRKVSAWTALREFFSISPLWLRGATAVAGLLLCALIVFAVSRTWQQLVSVTSGGDRKYSEQEFQQAVQKEVADQLAKLAGEKVQPVTPDNGQQPGVPVTARRSRPKAQPNRLTREEREQLAADLGLIPGREEEFPFVLPDEPND